jgi:hypothetical protein
VPVRLCSRCHGDLPTEVSGDLLYCPHCGAPQVILSEELREQFEQQQSAAQNPAPGADSEHVPVESISDPTAIAWSRALQLIALGGALFGLLLLIALSFPALGLFALLWTMIAPIVLLGIYAARHPQSRITTRFGARFGLLTGLSIGIAGLLIATFHLLVLRFALHQGPVIDQHIAAIVGQMQTPEFTKALGIDKAEMQHAFDLYNVPEYRAGLFLADSMVMVGMYAMYAAVAGAFSGLLRSRGRVRR